MTWLSPLVGIWAASIAVPSLLILYFLKLRRRDVEISTTLLWKKAIMDMQANAPFQRLRKNILLLLQLLILGAIAFALAQPQTSSQNLVGQMHVILLDRSASMGAEDVSSGGKPTTRLDQAKKEAIALVDSLREGGVLSRGEADKAMVIAFDETASVVQSFTTDKQVLRNAINSVTAGEGITSLKMAIELARANAPNKPNIDASSGRIEGTTGVSSIPLTMHLFSDGRIPDADTVSLGPSRDPTRNDDIGNTVVYHAVGTAEAPNVGIVALRAERAFETPNKITVFVSLINNEATPRDVDVELLVDTQPAGLRTVTVAGATRGNPIAASPNNSTPPDSGSEGPASQPEGSNVPSRSTISSPGVGGTIFQIDRPEGAIVQINLRQPASPEPPAGDVLDVDNRAYLAVPPAKRLSVGLVTRGSLVLGSLYDGLPVRTTRLSPEEFEKQLKDGTNEFDVVVLDGYLPTTGVGNTGLPPGRYLVLGAVPIAQDNGITDKGKGPGSSFIEWSRDHPALRSVGLENVVIAESRLVEVTPGSAATTIALSDKGPAIIELSSAETRALVVPFNPLDSNWPFDVSFVVFNAAAATYLGDDGTRGGSLRSVQPGQTLADRLPVGTTEATLESPGGASTRLTPATDGRIVFGPVPRTGLYTVNFTGKAGPADIKLSDNTAARVFTANLFDLAESDPRMAKEVPFASTVAQVDQSQSAKADRKLWPYLLLGALGIIMLEWFIYNRKVHV